MDMMRARVGRGEKTTSVRTEGRGLRPGRADHVRPVDDLRSEGPGGRARALLARNGTEPMPCQLESTAP